MCALVEGPLQLLDRPLRIGQREVGRGEDAVVVVEAPVVVQPAVERPEREAHRFGVVPQQLLVDHPERREQPATREPLIVERLQPSVAIAVLGADRLVIAQALERVDALGVAAEVVVQAARLRDRVERGVGDGAADAPADHVVLPAVDRGPLHAARPEGGVEVAGERVLGLVVVVVGVEDGVTELLHNKQWNPPFWGAVFCKTFWPPPGAGVRGGGGTRGGGGGGGSRRGGPPRSTSPTS